MTKSVLPPLMTDELPLRIEAAELPGGEELRVENRTEIESLLRHLAHRRELVCLYVDESDRFGLSAILDVSNHRFILEVPPGDMRSAITSAQKLLCVSRLQQVKLQFEAGDLQHVQWKGEAALSLALPTSVLRFQRRDFYRLTVPLGQPLSCFIPTGAGDEVEISLVDISIGGIGILGYTPGVHLDNGTRYQNVRIELPDTGTIIANIEVKASFDVTLKNGIRTVRTGAQFVNLPGTVQALIQRYITRIERARISREQGKSI